MSGFTRYKVWPVVVGLGLAAVVLFASHFVNLRQQEQAQIAVRQLAHEAAFRIQLLIGTRLAAGVHLQNQWRFGHIRSEQEFRFEAGSLTDIYRDIRAISRLDLNGDFTWVEPLAGNDKLVGVNIRDIPGARETFEQVAREKVPASSRPFDFVVGGLGFVNLYPLDLGGETVGYLNIAFHVEPVISQALGTGMRERYGIRIFYDGREVFQTGQIETRGDFGARGQFLVMGREWSAELSPTEEVLQAQVGNGHLVVLAIGLPAAFFMALLLWMFLARHQALQASEALAGALIDNVPSSLNIKGLDGRYLRVNRTFLDWAQKPEKDVIGKDEHEVHGERDGTTEAISDQEREVVQSNKPVHRERYGPFSDGVYRHVLVAKFPIPDGSGHIAALGTAVTDISRQKEAEEILRQSHEELEERVAERTAELEHEIRVREIAETSWRESEERLRDIAEAASDWFWEMDADLRFSYVSDRFCELTGVMRKDFIGRTRWEIAGRAGQEDNEIWRAHRDDLENRRAFKNFEYQITRPDGEVKTISISGRPMFEVSGEFAGYRGAGTDVSLTRSAERALLHAKEDLERRVDERTRELQQEVAERRRAQETADRASRAKTDFLANVSHEFRTPLNGIIGFSEILSGEVFGPLGSEKYREYAEDIIRSGRHLLSLINDVLDVSKIEAGAMEMREEQVDLDAAITETLGLVKQKAEDKELAIVVRVAPGLPLLIADETRVKQILLNLLANAVKFTDPGGEIGITAEWSTSAGHVLTVFDNGIGISSEDIPKILTPFGRARQAVTRAHDGFGLGLALVQSLVREHGGTLKIDSIPKQGTKIVVQFPLARTLRSHITA